MANMQNMNKDTALRLADELCEAIAEYPEPTALEAQAAAELRRLHAYCQELESQVILDCMTHVQNPAEIEHVAGNVSKNGAGLNMGTQHARITELESQLAQRFDAADMATAAASGFRDGVASVSAWSEHVEQRLLAWRQSFVNRSGDQLALDDFMDKQSLDDLIDFVCDEWALSTHPSPPEGMAGWTKASEQLPPCRDDQLYIGVNSAGFAGVFNAVADIAGNVHCMMETAEDSVSIMSDLDIWKPFIRPPISAAPGPADGESNELC